MAARPAALRLGGAGAVRLAPGVTNRAHLRAARSWAAGNPARATVPRSLERLSAAAEAVRFGGAPASEPLVRELDRHDAAATAAIA